MSPKILSILTGLFLLLSLGAGSIDARSLYWQVMDVQARLDRDGRLHVQETQTMVFDGDWNGGERRFAIRPGQALHFERLQRLDPVTGNFRELENGSLSSVDNYAWQDTTTLRWRSRLPSDPPFLNTGITYVLEYSLSGVVVRDGDTYLLDHDFAFPDRSGVIQRFSLTFEPDPVWQTKEGSPVHREIANLAPGQGLVIRLRLQHATGDPQETANLSAPGELSRFKTAPPPAPRWLQFLLSGLVWLTLAVLAVWLFIHERRTGRFQPLPSTEEITREWLKNTVFRLPPEVVGATWDKQTSQHEVAAVIARLVQEQRMSSWVEEFILPFFNIRIARLAALHMTLRVPRSSFSGYERKLIDGLFVAGDSTDTRTIRKYYRSRGTVFNPAAELAQPLDKKVEQLTRSRINSLKYFWAPTAILAAIGFFLLLTNAFIHQSEIILEVVGLFLLIFLWLFGVGFTLKYRNSAETLILNLLLMFLPPTLAAVGFSLIVTQSGSTLLLIGLFFFTVAMIHNICSLAKTRDNSEGVLLCQQLTAARKYFKQELQKARPDLEDSWFPYLMAFGLGEQIDRWFSQYGGSAGMAGAGDSTGTGISGFSGGGGQFGGGGASGAWMAAAQSLAAGSSSSSSGGGGGSSGGGGGGGW